MKLLENKRCEDCLALTEVCALLSVILVFIALVITHISSGQMIRQVLN